MSRPRVFVALVCGSRTWKNIAAVHAGVRQLCTEEPYLLVVTGGAGGVDTLADLAARSYGAHTAVIRALWANGKGAGMVRNRVMLDLEPVYVMAFRSAGENRGTDGCVRAARRRGIATTVFHEDGRIERFAALALPASDTKEDTHA